MVVSEGAISNIMGGMENSSGVRLHSHRHKLKQRFDIIRKLGQGTYGKVQLAVNKETGQEVAIKTIKKAKIETEQDLVRIRREIQIMSSVQHPQIIHIYEVFENREKMVLVMEYAAGGELYDYLSEKKVLSETEARRVFRHVASAVYYCHKHKICHRDLKLENILLDLDGNAKIADFGLSNVFDEKHRLDTFCGSPLYASPEIVKGVPYVGPEVDCWSLGVLLYTLVYGAMPFDGSNFRRLVKQITQGDFFEPSTPASASELIRHLLTVQSTERATVEDICTHWWVNQGYSESCLSLAETLANQTPVRLDLLLSLAPKNISSEHLLIQPEDDMTTSGAPDFNIPSPPQLPPVPTQEKNDENDISLPPRCHSMGSVVPPGANNNNLDLDLLLEKKRQERKSQEEKKRANEESSQQRPVEKKKKKDSSTKKLPSSSRSSMEDQAEIKKKDNSSTKKPPSSSRSSAEDQQQTETKKISVTNKDEEKKKSYKKRKESSLDKEENTTTKAKQRPPSLKSSSKDEDSTEVVKKEKIPSKKSPSPAPSTTSTLKASDSSISRKSVSPNKVLKEEPKTSKEEPKTPKEEPIISKEKSGRDATTATSSKHKMIDDKKATEKILQETAAKIGKVEEEENAEKRKQEMTATSPAVPPTPTATPLTSPSPQSSMGSTPARSRTESESSCDTRPTSRRQSKILSKAALFDSALGPNTKPAEKPKKKIKRPGALNMSDLAKRFEEKPSSEKKNKVVAPFKVSDAKKTFEAKSLSSSESPRRKTSSSGESIPTSPTKPEKSFVPPIKNEEEEPKKLKERRSPVKESSPAIEKPSRVTEKTTSVTKTQSQVAEKPSKTAPKSIKKEKSPMPSRFSKAKSPSPIKISAAASSVNKIPKRNEEKTEERPTSPASVVTNDVPKVVKKHPAATRIIEIRADTDDSSDSESEAEKMLRMLAEKREKLEKTKKEKMKKVSEDKAAAIIADQQQQLKAEAQQQQLKAEEQQLLKAEAQQSIVSEDPQDGQKFATLPRGFKSKTPVKPKSSIGSKTNSFDDFEVPLKRTQMEIVLNQQPMMKSSPLSKPTIKPQQSFEIKIKRENSRPEVERDVSATEVVKPTREPQLQRARRERIIPILMEDDDSSTSPPPPSVQSSASSNPSRSSSVCSSRVTNFGMAPISSTLGSSAAAERNLGQFRAPPDSIKKSRRERIIPIAVEGEGFVTPPISASASSEGIRTTFQPQEGTTIPVNGGKSFLLDRAESFSSAGEDDDEDEDDGFQILTAESLFSSLLSRVRSLTRKMTDEGRGLGRSRTPQQQQHMATQAGTQQDSSGFWSSLYSPPRDSPTRRVSGASNEEEQFGSFGSPLWSRNSTSRNGSDAESVFSEYSTLPRADFLRDNVLLRQKKMFNDPFFSDITRT